MGHGGRSCASPSFSSARLNNKLPSLSPAVCCLLWALPSSCPRPPASLGAPLLGSFPPCLSLLPLWSVSVGSPRLTLTRSCAARFRRAGESLEPLLEAWVLALERPASLFASLSPTTPMARVITPIPLSGNTNLGINDLPKVNEGCRWEPQSVPRLNSRGSPGSSQCHTATVCHPLQRVSPPF